jgi:predicted GNAT superfamily acetyltransferase
MTADVEIRLIDDAAEMRRIATLFDQVWGAGTPLVNVELARAIAHAGGYVAAVFVDDQVVGGSIGFLARHRGADALHSHLTGVLPGVRGTGLGARLKFHQRAWAAERRLAWVTWTFDPLVRRNARFNLRVLGAQVEEYLVDFYGPIDDAINARGASDRLLVAWSTTDTDRPAEEPAPPGAVAVPTPEDVVALRRTDRAAADEWRLRLRVELGDRLAAGGRIVSFTDDGDYLVVPAP